MITDVREASPVRLLLGDYHLRLLGLLFMRADDEFHLREIERQTGVPAPPARRELERFVRAGLVSSRRVGNQVRYRANRTSVVFDELASMLRKTVGLADVLREALTALAQKIDAAFIFGSAAQGTEGPYSDVDLMVLGPASFDEVVEATYKTQAKLGRPVNPIIFRTADFRDKLRSGDAFVKRVMTEPRIMVMGSLDEFGEPSEDRPTQTPHSRQAPAGRPPGGRRAKPARRGK